MWYGGKTCVPANKWSAQKLTCIDTTGPTSIHVTGLKCLHVTGLLYVQANLWRRHSSPTYLHQQRCRSMAVASSLPLEQPFVSAVGRGVTYTPLVWTAMLLNSSLRVTSSHQAAASLSSLKTATYCSLCYQKHLCDCA